jgi:serine/threonine-protein kinase HipA
LNDVFVGYLSETEDGRVTFRFAEEYRRRIRRPVLSQSFEDDLLRIYRGKDRELPAFFANLVPEGHLRDLIEQSIGLERGDDLGLLAAVGFDLPGAVDIQPLAVNGDAIYENGEEPLPVRLDEDDKEPGLRFSLAGVQLKFSVAREFEKLTLPAHGKRGEWIVKLDSPRFANVVENEFAILEWAAVSGFDVPERSLISVTSLADELRAYATVGTHVLVVRRYDRQRDRRIHQEDFAQVTSRRPSKKYDHITYEQCAALANRIIGADAYYEFVRRLVFVIASGNSDAHLKNWSLLYPDGISPVLTPLYDQVSTIAWPEVTRELALKLAGVKPMLQIDEAAFARLADRAQADRMKTIVTVKETVARVADAWLTAGVTDVLPQKHVATLREYWSRAPLLKGHAGALFRSRRASDR